MPTTDPKAVPLNVWVPEPAPTGTALRRHLAARLVETYSAPASVVIDLCPERGEVLAAAASAARGVVALRQPPGCAGRPRPPALEALAGAAALAVALPPASHLVPPRPHPVSATAAKVLCRRAAPLLAVGGYLVIGTLGRGAGSRPDPISAAVGAAAEAGLDYHQHLVVLLDSERDPAPSATGSGRRLAHADLLVFTKADQ